MIVAIGVSAASARPDQRLRAESLFQIYQAGDYDVLARTVTTAEKFDLLRADLIVATKAWKRLPRRIHYAFMLDLVKVGLDIQAVHWLHEFQGARGFIMNRPDRPGQNPSEDAFEILWHKTAFALLCAPRRPDFVWSNVAVLSARMASTPSNPGARPVLVDPWIELAQGFAEEGFSLVPLPARPEIKGPVGREALVARGPAALDHYSAALAFPSTRAEAAARKAWLLVRLNRPGEAIATLDVFDDRWTDDPVIRYWVRLFRGAALDKLGRLEEAIRAYHDALTVVPGAQSPRVALMGLELARDQRDAAYALATAVRTAPEVYNDPWWLYPYGERRFLNERLAALRAEARR
jgi:hypothetical protein